MFVRLVRASSLVLLLIQVMSTLVLLASATADLNDESVYKDLMDGTRGILIIGTLVHGNSTIVMIAQLNNAGELISYDDIYVYQLATTYNTSTIALKGGQMLKDKWPALQNDIDLIKPKAVALIADEDDDYFLSFGYEGYSHYTPAFAFNHNASSFSGVLIPSFISNRGYKLISSSERLKIYTIYYNEAIDKKSLGYFIFPCSGIHCISNLDIPWSMTNTFKDAFCFDSNSSMVTMKYDDFGHCNACTWDIQAGFMDEKQIILFDKDKTVYKFPKAAIEGSQNISFKFETSSISEFFESPDGKLTTTTSTTKGPPSTSESTSDSSSDSTSDSTSESTSQTRSSDEPHSKEPSTGADPHPSPNHNTGGHHPQDYTAISEAKGSNGGLIAGIVIFVIALIAAAVGAYLYFCYCNSSDKNNLPKADLKGSSGKQTGGKGAKSSPAIAGKQSRRNSLASGKSRGGKSLAKSRGALRSKRSAGKSSRAASRRPSSAAKTPKDSRRSVGKSSQGTSQGDAAKSSRPSLQAGVKSRRRSSRPSSKRASSKGMSTGRVSTGRLSGARPSIRPSSARPSSARASTSRRSASRKQSQKR